MRFERAIFTSMIFAAVLAVAVPAFAVRYATRPLLLNRAAVSGYVSESYPVGEFSDSRDGYGNHAAWPLGWAADIEYFAGRTWSVGFGYATTTFEDKTDPSLETNVGSYSGFIRVVVPTAFPVRPYLRGGMGGMTVEFLDPDARYKANAAFTYQVGGGLLWLPARWLGFNAQVLYYHGSTSDEYLKDVPNTVVGFDTQYWAFSGGISLFFPD